MCCSARPRLDSGSRHRKPVSAAAKITFSSTCFRTLETACKFFYCSRNVCYHKLTSGVPEDYDGLSNTPPEGRGYSVRIRESHTPGRKVGLWGCDFCDFTHVNVAKVQAHVHELHLAALRRSWDEVAALWQQHQREASYDEGSNSGSGTTLGHANSPAALQHPHLQQQLQQATVAGRQFRFAVPVMGQGSGDSGGGLVAVQYMDAGDDAGSLPLEPIVICKIDEDEEDGSCVPSRSGPPSF